MNKVDAINILIKEAEVDTNKISDGYHTFEELYDHRCVLFITACRMYHYWRAQLTTIKFVWRSLCHADGSVMPGWFVLGIKKEDGQQITYHLPEKYWDEAAFAETLDMAPPFDGHTSEDVLKRLLSL